MVLLFSLSQSIIHVLLLLTLYASGGGPQQPVVQAAQHFKDNSADELSINPREYYLGPYGTRCIHSLARDSTSEDAARRLPCFSGRGVRVALLDTGVCEGIAESSRNSIVCTSVVPGVACEDVGCAHGTRSVSVLAGHLSVPTLTPPLARGGPEASVWGKGFRPHHLMREYVGLAPNAAVRMFRVFDREGRTRRSYITRALDILLREAEADATDRRPMQWNTSNSPRPLLDDTVDVISLSYGGEDYTSSPQIQDQIHRLMQEHGVIVVAAAGNDSARFGSVRSPADMPGVLAVGALGLDPLHNLAQKRRASRAWGTDAVADVAKWPSTDRARKYVAYCSGRGPTSWELPFGAGRIKPDLVAIGQNVWAVQGVSAVEERPAATSPVRRVSPVLQMRSASGTSIAAPIVAGIVALCLEAARSSVPIPASASAAPARNASLDLYHRRLARIADSLQVREAIVRTAAPLKSATPFDSDASPSTTPGEHRHRVLAGVPLVQLYARYLHLSRFSILAQGMGEVRPLRALRAIVAATRTSPIRDAPYSLRHCASFAVPPSVYLGFGSRTCANDGGSDSTHTPQSRRSGCDAGREEVLEGGEPRDAPGTPSAPDAAYWWPFSDHMVYPGASPVLLNISLHMCPSFSPTAAGARFARLRSESPYVKVTYVVTTVRGCVRTQKSRPFGDDCSLSLLPTDAPGRRGGGGGHSISLANSATHNASPTPFSQSKVFEKNEATGIGQGQREKGTYRFVKGRSAPQQWLAGLVRVATELTDVTGGSGTRRSSGQQQQPEKMPPTSFSLSVAVSSPSSAETHICYELATRTVSVRSVAVKRSMMHGNSTHADQKSSDDRDGNGGCVPLFNAFRALHVEGALQIFTAGSPSSSSQPSLTVPLHVRLLQPPPRARRVLIDTSLDWFNPTTHNSTLFIAGDDPHESPAGGIGVAPRCGGMRHGYPRAYAEASGGDHPHTNLSLLWLYLRHTLGLSVEVFPLLHTSTMDTPISTGGNATASPELRSTSNLLRSAQESQAGVLTARIGTLIVIDPERPLTAKMRRLLTRAVLSDGADHPTDGLNVVLVTDWYSANVSAGMRWTRDESTRERSSVSDEGDVVRSLRTRRHLPNGTVSGLAGSSHVVSWNRWLSELSAASSSRTRCSGCHGVTSHNNSDPLSATSELPFVLSDDIVMDGVLVVDAAAPARRGQSDDNAERTHGSGTTAETVAVRSLGQLNGAGVLQWRYPLQTPLQRKQKTEKHIAEVSITPSAHGCGEAVMCNSMPRWAQQQRRLVKRIVVEEGDNLTVVSRDTWESMPNIDWRKEMSRIKGLETMEKGAGAPSANGAQVRESLSYGVLGFFTPPPLCTRNTTEPTNHPRPGRIAIFTDSDCLSTSDHHVQAVLGELEGLLHPSTLSPGAACATWGCFAQSPEGQTLLQAESTHSSTCVEVLKEMLLWTHTGNLYRWQEASKLHCEARTWVREARGCPPNFTPDEHRVNQDEAGPDNDDSGPSGTRFDDLVGTAPERAEVGEVVWRLWSSLGDVPARDTALASPERLAGKTNVWGDEAANQKHAVDRMMHALMMKYHGDWRVHLEDCDVPHACTSAVGDSPPPPQDRFSVESILPLRYMADALRWLLHPIVLGQLMLGAAASACLLLCRLFTGRVHARNTSPHGVAGVTFVIPA